jgi:histidyl-tRNA synthetase
MANGLQAVRGMNDVLPDEAPLWERFEDTARSVFAQYGYRNIRVPIVEPTALFVRGIGEFTDVVETEMYTFEDKLNGESLTLRPEATAGIVRSTIQHHLTYDRPQRVWTSGPMFRHERPQGAATGNSTRSTPKRWASRGRTSTPSRSSCSRACGRRWTFPASSSTSTRSAMPTRRLAHRSELVAYLEHHADVLDANARRRLHENPLRILDSKNPAMQPVLEAAPKLIDFIEDKSLAHFEALQALLRDGRSYQINPRLVRGLDYYNRTVFRWVATGDTLGAQGTVAGGGRYDSLFELLGGERNFACGFAIGVERMILLLQAGGVAATTSPLAYIVHAGADAAPLARRIGESLRDGSTPSSSTPVAAVSSRK